MVKEAEQSFKKEQLLKAEVFREKKDLAQALLKDGQEYTRAEAEALIERFMKGEVK